MVHSSNALLTRQLALQPEAVAFVISGQPVTVRQFEALVRRAAVRLADQGLGRGDVLALWLVNGLDWLVLYFAANRLGLSVMTVNTRYRSTEVAYLLARSRPKLLVLQRRFRQIDFAAMLAEVDATSASSLQAVWLVDDPADADADADAATDMATGSAPALPTLLGLEAQAFDLHALPEQTGHAELPPLDEPDLPSIMFTTSGTTSGPKLVVHSQRTVAVHLQQVAMALQLRTPGTRLLAALPLAGVFGFVSALAFFAAGQPVVVNASFDAAECAKQLQQPAPEAITHFFGSDEMFEAVLQQVPGSGASGPGGASPFPALRLCGFAAFRAGAHGVARAAVLRGLPMVGLYGSSEVFALFSLQRPDRALDERLEGGGSLVNPDAQLRVRDADTGALLGPGEVGLLEIRSPSNFLGYLNNPDATAEALAADGFFRTGDIGLLRADGSFVYQTRAGDAIRLGGYLVAPAEIEELVKAEPGIHAAQVVAVDWQGKTRAVAFVVLAEGAAFSAQALIDRLGPQLAAFKLPLRIWQVDAFPVVNSANGTKIQRHKLREWAQQNLAREH